MARHGRELTREIWGYTAENHQRLAETLAGRAAHRRKGSRVMAATAAEKRQLAESAELMAADGWPVELRGGSLYNSRDGKLNPAQAVGALASDVSAGVIAEGVAVASLNELPLDADEVVLATNAFTETLLPGIPITPVRAQMLATAPDAEVGFDLSTTATIQAHLESLGVTAPVTHRWAGTMGFTPDALPLVGRLAPRLSICAGYTGHGMAFAFLCARQLADHLAGGPPPPQWLDPRRFPIPPAT